MSTIAKLGARLQQRWGGKPGTHPLLPASWLLGPPPESRKRHGQLEMGNGPGELGLPASRHGMGVGAQDGGGRTPLTILLCLAGEAEAQRGETTPPR